MEWTVTCFCSTGMCVWVSEQGLQDKGTISLEGGTPDSDCEVVRVCMRALEQLFIF